MTHSNPTHPFPAYTHIPGVTPHPIGDTRGHSFGLSHVACATPEWASLPDCELFQRGLQLFNAGYYWEAHEAWEGVWIAVGRSGLVADFLKGLIKLAAAGVKLREGSTVGAQRHLARAEELLILTHSRLSEPPDCTTAAARSGWGIEPLLELVRRLRQVLPQIPDPQAGKPVSMMGQI